MAENFTAKQKEIVARKLGYDGPMQGFDDFLNSSPALGMKYATLSDKFATRMAKGGLTRKKFAAGGAVTQDYVNQLVREAAAQAGGTLSFADASRAAANLGIPASQISAALSTGVITGAPAPAAVPTPVYEAPAPVYEAPAPVYEAPAPTPTPAPAPVTQSAYSPTSTAAYTGASHIADGVQLIPGAPGYDPNKAAMRLAEISTYGGTAGAGAAATLKANNLYDTGMAQWQTELNRLHQQDIAAGRVPVDTPPPVATATANTTTAAVPKLPANYDQNYVNQLVREAAQAAGGTLSYADFTRAAGTLGIPTSMMQGALSTGVVTGAPTGTTTGTITGTTGTTTKTTTGTTTGTTPTTITQGGVTTSPTTGLSATGAPNVPGATTITAAQTTISPDLLALFSPAGTTQKTELTKATGAVPVSLPSPITAPTITAASATPAVTNILTGLDAQQGIVSEAAKITAATQAPETTAVAGMQAAQGVAGTVQGAPTRTAQAGEMVAGPAVDMARAEEVMAQTQAAQGVVTEEMTVQGQLNKLLTDFDAGAPPPWAAASMRTATAQMAARGLGASSMAGQAIIQATLEAATPIAAADAKVFETMGLQNLSNRQQVAMLVGQQRAAFLGQEFDQAFQTRVLNAARVADIANKNFDAQTQIAIENSRLANTMDVANLSAKNAVVMAKMAQMSQLETTNLNNRQQAAVENAKAFLTMDIKNLDNRQQTALFRAQEMNDALVSDAGFANAVNITNAQNTLDAAKVSASLALTAEQFNAEMFSKVNMANALAANEIGKFNAQQANAREEFNSNMNAQINLANAKILAEISTANTAAVNAANAVNAKNATDLSAAAYAQQSQTYRDLLEMSWKTGESEKDRATSIVAATLGANASTNAAKTTANSESLASIAKAGIALLSNYDKTKASLTSIVKDIFGP